MSISQEEFKALARLSELEFSDEEAREFIPGFEEIIAFAGRINEEVSGDTSTIKEVSALSVRYDDLREDDIVESLPAERITSGVEGKDGYFPVRRVVK